MAVSEKKERPVLTVTQLNEYIKGILDKNTILSALSVKGEISNFTRHKSGHLYFTIKDEGSNIKAVMFASSAAKLKFAPENGLKVIASGRVSAYVRDGSYQIYVDAMEPDGIGSLALAYEQLKKKLAAEGLFDPAHKKPIPKIPSVVGVITSPTGAAIRDIINITSRRFPYAKLLLYPANVQGAEAAPALIEGVRWFSHTKAADVLIIGRGGGSMEDLWAFNDEKLAREIYACSIPVISAVGHEIDFTISDFVADLRAPTPSAAAELAVPDSSDLVRKMYNVVSKMEVLLDTKLTDYKRELDRLKNSHVMQSPMNLLDDKRIRIDRLEERLESAAELAVKDKKVRFMEYASKLDALNPLSVLTRGFAATFREDGKLIKSVDDLEIGDTFEMRLRDGSVKARAVDKEIKYE